MNLELNEMQALTRELHQIIENDRPHCDTEGDPGATTARSPSALPRPTTALRAAEQGQMAPPLRVSAST